MSENENTETTEETPVAEETVVEETTESTEETTEAPAPQQGDAGSAGGEAADAQQETTGAGGASGPKPKRKRLPRALRPQKTRPQRERSATRKPISREPKPEHERGRTQERRGIVVSDAMDKTIVVKVDVIKSHPKYKKVIRRSVKFHAHDEQNAAHVGDVVRIVETRPLSKTKRWRLAEVVEVAK
jgi:ribosomal protein uS17